MKVLKKFICILLALAIVIGLFSSDAFISRNTHHHCCGEECHICEQLQMARSIIRRVSTAIASVYIVVSLCVLAQKGMLDLSDSIPQVSPITLKVKMLD